MIVTNIQFSVPVNYEQSLSSGLGQFVGGYGRQSPWYNGSSSSQNLNKSITTTGKKVAVRLVPTTVTEALPFGMTGSPAHLRIEAFNFSGAPATSTLISTQWLMRDGIDIAVKVDRLVYTSLPDITANGLQILPISTIDIPSAGTHTYRFEWSISVSGSVIVNTSYCRMFKLIMKEI